MGFSDSYNKTYSSCPYTYTACKALFHLSEALNMRLQVRWTPRVSGKGEKIADHLSKGKFKEASEVSPGLSPSPSYIPRTLLSWIRNPIRVLGQAIIEEMSDYTEVLRCGVERQSAVDGLVVRAGSERVLYLNKPNHVEQSMNLSPDLEEEEMEL